MDEKEKENRRAYIPPCSVCPNLELDDEVCFNGKSSDDCPACRLSETLSEGQIYKKFKEWFMRTPGFANTRKYDIAEGIYHRIIELEEQC